MNVVIRDLKNQLSYRTLLFQIVTATSVKFSPKKSKNYKQYLKDGHSENNASSIRCWCNASNGWTFSAIVYK